MPPQPAFGGVTDVLTSSSTPSSTGIGQSPDGFITSNIFDNQGFSSAGLNSNNGQGFVGVDAGISSSSSQSFTPSDFSLSGSSGLSGASSSLSSVPSLADAFSVSLSDKGTTNSMSNQASTSAMDGLFDMGRGNANDAIFGGTLSNSRFGDMSSGAGQMSRTDNQGQMTDNRFTDTRIPGFDISSASGSNFNFDRASDSSGLPTSNLPGGFGSAGRTGDISLSSSRFGGGSPPQVGANTMLPGIDMGMRQGAFSNSRTTSRDFRDTMSITSDRFAGSTRDSSSLQPFGMDRVGSEPGMGGRTTFGMGGGSDMATGMGSSMGSRMTGTGSGIGLVGSGSDRMGLGIDRISTMSEMGGTVRGNMGVSGSGQDISGGVRSDMSGRTFGRDMGISTQRSDMNGMGEMMRRGIAPMGGMGGGMGMTGAEMTGRLRIGMGSRMSPTSGMGMGMGVTGSEMTRGMAGMGERSTGIGGGVSGIGGGMSGMGGPMSGMGGAMPGMGGAGIGRPMPGMGGAVAGMGGPGSMMMGRGGFMGGTRAGSGPGFDRSLIGSGGSPMRDPRMGPGFGPGRPGMGPGPGAMIGGPGMRPGPGPMPRPMGPGMMPPFIRRGMPPFMGRGPMRRGMIGFRRRR